MSRIERASSTDVRELWEPLIQLGHGDEAILIRGEALAIYNSLVHDLASSAFEQGGHQGEGIEKLLNEACVLAAGDGDDPAVERFFEQLDRESAPWLVAGRLRGITPARDFDIGTCRITQSLEGLIDGKPITGFKSPPFISTTVMAKDRQSAEVVAMDRFGEIGAILALSDLNRSRPVRPLITRSGGDTASFGSGRHGSFITGLAVNPVREERDVPALTPEYQILSDAAALPHGDRPDWPKRVIAAARWLYRAMETTWVSEALSTSMSALECLLIAGMSEHQKGKTIAERATRLYLFREYNSLEDQTDWLREMYRRRNDVVHEGASVTEDLDVLRVMDLTKLIARWGVHHLSPYHRTPNGSCMTFQEVFDSMRHQDPLARLDGD